MQSSLSIALMLVHAGSYGHQCARRVARLSYASSISVRSRKRVNRFEREVVDMGKKSFHDALELAAHDETFAKALIGNPSAFRDEYQLDDEQIATICSANETAVLQ